MVKDNGCVCEKCGAIYKHMRSTSVCKCVRTMTTEHSTGSLVQSTAQRASFALVAQHLIADYRTQHSIWSLLQSTASAHHAHMVAVILHAAMSRLTSESYSAERMEAWFKNIQKEIIDVTFVPLTRCALAKRSERPPGKKQRHGGIVITTMESISRCVAAYHKVTNAAEYDQCEGIVENIGAYAHTLCMKTSATDELVNLLHQWIENRSINMALKLCVKTEEARLMEIVRSSGDCPHSEERTRAIALMEAAIEIVRTSGDELRRRVLFLPDFSN